MDLSSEWYLVRTKPGKERWVCEQLSTRIAEVFLPMLKSRTARWGRLVFSVSPLFPCYAFARFSFERSYFEVKYLPGVSGIVSAGTDPLMVPHDMVAGIKSRCVDGVLEIPDKPIGAGERVIILDGPLRGFEAIFDRYLSGAERVAILLGAVENARVRVVLRARQLARCS